MYVLQLVPYVVSIVRFYCTLTGPIGDLNCEVLLYFNNSASIHNTYVPTI